MGSVFMCSEEIVALENVSALAEGGGGSRGMGGKSFHLNIDPHGHMGGNITQKLLWIAEY